MTKPRRSRFKRALTQKPPWARADSGQQRIKAKKIARIQAALNAATDPTNPTNPTEEI